MRLGGSSRQWLHCVHLIGTLVQEDRSNRSMVRWGSRLNVCRRSWLNIGGSCRSVGGGGSVGGCGHHWGDIGRGCRGGWLQSEKFVSIKAN